MVLGVFIFASCKSDNKTEQIIEKYDDGSPKLVFVYNKDSVKIAEIGYTPDHKIRMEGNCEGDKYVGVWKYYHANGQLFAQGDFKNQITGDDWIFNDSTGKSMIEPGYKVKVISFNNNEFSPSELHLYQDNTNQVIDIKFCTNYKPFIIERLAGGVRNGISTSWFCNGFKNSECNYSNGMKNGIYRVWHENGQLLCEGQYAMDQKVGLWKYFEKDGNLALQEDYDLKNSSLNKK